MKFIIYYDKEISSLGSVLAKSVKKKWDKINIEIFTDISGLTSRMKKCDSFENEIYMFLIDSKSRLLEFIHLSHWVEDKRIILIVPEESEETMRLSIQLYPRYIAKISDDYQDLHLVLEKMVKDHTFAMANR